MCEDISVLAYPNANCITAISMLREREPGAFVIRDSHSFRGAYGLAMKVASPPPSVHQSKKGKRWWCSGALVDKICIL